MSVQYNLPIRFSLSDTLLFKRSNSDSTQTFKERFEKAYSDSTIQKSNSGIIMSYVFNSTELGWINCDRFFETNQRTDYIVKSSDDLENVRIIFHRYKSLLPGTFEKGKYIFEGVPSGEKITIVAIKRIEGKPYLAVKETLTSAKVENNLSFKPVTMELLKEEMRKLDKF